MQIQPYFPEPLRVSHNVAGERYIVTLSFLRAVMAGHFVSVLAVVGVAVLLDPVVSLGSAAWVLAGCLLGLTLVRRTLDGGNADSVLSLLLLVPTVWSLGTVVAYLSNAGLPMWIAGVSYLCAATYAAVCGRDFSFIGLVVITMIATAITFVAGVGVGQLTWGDGAFWALAGVAYVLYYAYDLAALLSRRRLGEEPAAVADLYRDLLNFSTYSVRVVLHWRRFRFI